MFIVCLQTTLGVHAVLPSTVGFYIISTLVIIIVLLIINDENVSKGLFTNHIELIKLHFNSYYIFKD